MGRSLRAPRGERGRLLDHVGQFVGQEFPARARRGREPAGIKYHVVTDGVRDRVHGASRLRCPGVGVDPYATEVVAEPQLEIRLSGIVQRLAGRAQDLVHDRRGQSGAVSPCNLALNAQVLLAALCAHLTHPGCAAASAFALQQPAASRHEG